MCLFGNIVSIFCLNLYIIKRKSFYVAKLKVWEPVGSRSATPPPPQPPKDPSALENGSYEATPCPARVNLVTSHLEVCLFAHYYLTYRKKTFSRNAADTNTDYFFHFVLCTIYNGSIHSATDTDVGETIRTCSIFQTSVTNVLGDRPWMVSERLGFSNCFVTFCIFFDAMSLHFL